MAGKWDEVDRIIRDRGNSDNSQASNQVIMPEILPPVAAETTMPTPITPEPGNIIDRYRARQIDRKVARAHWEQYYNARLELVGHELKEAVRAKSAEMTAKVERVLMQLNDSHLQFLAELGLKNVGQRQSILIKLQEQTSRQIQDVMERDWPQQLKDQTIDQLLGMSKAFADRLNCELGAKAD